MLTVGPPTQLAIFERQMLDDNWDEVPIVFQVHNSLAQDPSLHAANEEGGSLYNFSFSRQLGCITTALASEVQLQESVGYFLTANSALPLAHTITGYYRERDLPLPFITSIAANQNSKFMSAQEKSTEISRLRKLLGVNSIKHAVIVDEYVESGSSLTYASSLLNAAGIGEAAIYKLAGRWYPEVYYDDANEPNEFMNVNPANEPLAAWFTMIGSLAAKSSVGARAHY